ncbi:hypothetical protein CBL_20915 [Carabus blaptoides fortunei]
MSEMKSHPLKVNDVKVLWEELSNILKRKKGAIKNKKDRTGGGPATGTNLGDLEEGLVVLIGWNTVEDCDAVAQEMPPEEISISYVFSISLTIDIYLSLGDLAVVADTSYYFMTELTFMTKCMIFTFKRSTFVRLLEYIEGPIFSSHLPEQEVFLK